MRPIAFATFALALSAAASPAWAIGVEQPGALTPTTLKLPAGPGSVRGLADDAEANLFTGEVQYKVPVDLPGAVRGFRPSLDLQYSGALGNGPMGIGWTLAVPQIRRTLRLGVPSYTSADELELVGVGSGGRLVPLPDGTFRVEGQGNGIKVSPRGMGFVVTDASGIQYRFGISAASRQAGTPGTQAWMLDAVVDLAAQQINLSYRRDDGELYLQSMVWGPQQIYRATLEYEVRSDKVVSYRRGYRVGTGQRLRRITVTVSAVTRHSYLLAYDNALPVSRLASVTELGTDGTSAWPTLSFGYGQANTPTVAAVPGADGWRIGQNVTLMDVDGDGVSDLVHIASDANEWRRNLGGKFGPSQPLVGGPNVGLDTARLMDVYGDARPELVVSNGSSWTVYRMQAQQWVLQGSYPGSLNVPVIAEYAGDLDINGDGRTDVLAAASGDIAWYRNNGTGMDVVSRPAIAGDATLTPDGAGVRFFDVNGDGLDDVLRLGNGSITFYLGHGDGIFDAGVTTPYPWGSGQAVDLANVHLSDLNRDGLMDLVRVTDGTVEWYRGRVGGTFEATPQTIARPEGAGVEAVVTLADVQGNGSDDVVWSSPRGMWVLDLAGPTTFGMLSRIDNGLGATTTFSYAASAVLALADEATGARWARTLPMSMPVPVSRTIDPGAGQPLRPVGYGVRDGFWDFDERRFGGFQTATETHPAVDGGETRAVTTSYHLGLGDDRVLRGRPLLVKTFRGSALHELERLTWQAGTIDGLPAVPLARKVELVSRALSSFEGQPSGAPLTTSIQYSYDGAGNNVEERDLGRTDLTGDERTVRRVYASDDTTWVRDLVIDETTLAADGTTVLSHRKQLYGDDTQQLPYGQVGKGWLREADQLLVYGSDNRWVPVQQIGYDALGQRTTIIEHGVTRRIGYDALDRHPISEAVQAQPGTTLTWKMSWDPTLDLPTDMTDPNGQAQHVSYDALGRTLSIGLAGRPAHTIYSYAWSAPAPRTITYEFDGEGDKIVGFGGSWSSSPNWRQTVIVANGVGEEVATAVRLADAQWVVRGVTRRDARGRVSAITEPFYSQGADVPTVTPTGAPATVIKYDALDRPIEQDLASGTWRKTVYAAFAQEETVSGLAPMRSRYDGLGRINHTERTINGTVESVDATYDALGQILQLSLQGGRVTHRFEYDTLARLRHGNDPDIGPRSLAYDDAGHLTRYTNGVNQTIDLTYDGAGRVVSVGGSDGNRYVYHYDQPKSASDTNTASRVAWIEEPTGIVELSYDAFGHEVARQRTVQGRSAGRVSSFSPGGQLLAVGFGDGVDLALSYDRAGRQQSLGSVWQALALDAAGRPLSERYGNGVGMLYERDAIGQNKRIQIVAPSGGALYDVKLARNAFGAVSSVTDDDGVGLDHHASYGFDGAARLTSAVLGSGATSYNFSYAYDGLQNMITRGASGPRDLGILTGSYAYGEKGAGPRQLTSVSGGHRMTYDAAGRQISDDGRVLTYNALDQLVAVSAPAVGSTPGALLGQHQYGYDGMRVFSKDASGKEQRWWTADIVERNGLREHYLRVGDRVVARLSVPTTAVAAVTRTPRLMMAGLSLVWLLALGVLLWRTPGARRRLGWATAMMLLALFPTACGGMAATQALSQRVVSATAVYYHQGVSAGPLMMTDATGKILEERRFEPFGQPIDAYRQTMAGGQQGAVDFTVEPLNSLDKETDVATGWSYHGARWMAPQSGRWLTPDPPTRAPDPKFMAAPWTLHPYQYVSQNPVQFWDPDGREGKKIDGNLGVTFGKTAYATATSGGVKVEVGKVQVGASAGPGGASVGGKVTAVAIEKSGAPIAAAPGFKLGVGANYGEASVKAGVDAKGVGASAKASLVNGNVSAEVEGVGKVKVEAGVQLGIGIKLGSELKGDYGPVSVSVDVTPVLKSYGDAAMEGAKVANQAIESATQANETVMGVGGDGESTSRLQHLDKEELPEGGVPEPAPAGG